MGRPKLPEGEALKRKYARNKRWRDANREKMNAYSRARNLHPDRLVYMQNYAEANAERVREIKKDHWDGKGLSLRRKRRGYSGPVPPVSAVCDLCGKPPIDGKKLHLDHDHVTGEFRGWLHMGCNTGIGRLGDNLEGLLKAVAYLSKPKH